jgi:hypothetical protein
VYELIVFCPGERTPHETIRVNKASEVLQLIPELLAQHDACEHIVVMMDHARLFAVDCKGNRLP